MKKRRLLIAAFIVCALACIGLGYAALTDSISLIGNINTLGGNIENTSVFNVAWEEDTQTCNVDPVGTPGLAGGAGVPFNFNGEATVENASTAKLDIYDMAVPGEKVTATYVVQNLKTDAGYAATVTAAVSVKKVLDGGTKEDVQVGDLPFSISAGFGVDGSQTTITINNDAEATFTVIVEMEKTLTENANYEITITLNATAIEG